MSNFEINIPESANKLTGKFKGKGKYLLIVLFLLVAMPFVRGLLFSWKVIEPGYTGIKINRLVNKGVTREDIVTGFIFYNPIQSAIVMRNSGDTVLNCLLTCKHISISFRT